MGGKRCPRSGALARRLPRLSRREKPRPHLGPLHPPSPTAPPLSLPSFFSALRAVSKSADRSASSAWLALSKRAVAALSDVILEW